MRKILGIIFCVFCIGTVSFGVYAQDDLSERTKNIYATVVTYTAENDSANAYLEIAQRSHRMFRLLEEHAGAFVMDAYNYQDIDGEGTPLYTMNGLSLPVEIDAGGHMIRVSQNYFKYNPIETVTGQPIVEQMVLDDNTLNILVPERHRPAESDILQEYRALFYYEKVTVANNYNEEAGLSLLDISEDSLNVNIIYVKDGQQYFTYRADLAPQTHNSITDPIVCLYTDNIHVSYAHSFLSQFTYFFAEQSGEKAAYGAIFPYIQQCEAEDSFQKVTSVHELFERNGVD